MEGKLEKIVELARHGVGGEKETAIRMVKKICEKNGLEFDDIMSDSQQIHKYEIKYRSKPELNVITGVICKMLDVPSIQYNAYYKRAFFETTSEKYIDIIYAIDIYLRAFRKERRRMASDLNRAFVIRHQLWGSTAEPETVKDSEYDDYMRRIRMAEGLDHVEVNKAIESGDNT